jgi:hypothetical protein
LAQHFFRAGNNLTIWQPMGCTTSKLPIQLPINTDLKIAWLAVFKLGQLD